MALDDIKKVFPDARLMVGTRHSRDLVEAVKAVRAKYPDAQEAIENGKWFIKTSEMSLGPFDTQWEAWMTAKDWDVEGTLGQSNA